MPVIEDWADLQTRLGTARAAGAKVVFTNGVFDLIHSGHIRYLTAARKLGDLLIVAVNTDSSVRRNKGPFRPLLAETERAKIIAALEAVDFVTLFSEDTPLNVVKAVRPDVLVKGGDYAIDNIVGRAEVESTGGTVLTIPVVDGLSTSAVIEKVLVSSNI